MSSSWSPLASFSRLRTVGPPSGRRARDGAVCWAAAVILLGRLAECARFSPAWAMLVAPVVSARPWRRKGSQSCQPLVCRRVGVAHRPSVAPAVSVTLRAGCQRRRPSVPPAAYRPFKLVAPKVSTRLGQWPQAGNCSSCRWYPSRAGPSPHFSGSLRNVRLPSAVVETGPFQRGGTACFVHTRSMPTHPSGGSAVQATMTR